MEFVGSTFITFKAWFFKLLKLPRASHSAVNDLLLLAIPRRGADLAEEKDADVTEVQRVESLRRVLERGENVPVREPIRVAQVPRLSFAQSR